VLVQKRYVENGYRLVGLLLLLVLMVWVPMSAAAYEGTPGTIQATPTVDLTVTALAKEQLTLQVKQLQDQNNWLVNNSTALIAAVATVIVALFGILQWAMTVRQAQSKELRDREDERQKEIALQDKESKDRQAVQDKELRAQAEERFRTAVTALGNENEATQVEGAILLRSFLNPDDKEIYGRYYAQIFDLAVAYLRLSSKSQSLPHPDIPLPLTPLRQALIVVFKEAFPFARKSLGQIGTPLETRSLDASGIRLDGAYLVASDLKHIWMIDASLIDVRLGRANLHKADLRRAFIIRTFLNGADLSETSLFQAIFADTDLSGADLRSADLRGVKFNGTILTNANLSGANLGELTVRGENIRAANPEDAQSLKDTNLCGVKGLTKEQLEACKAKGAIVDEDTVASPSQLPVSPPASS